MSSTFLHIPNLINNEELLTIDALIANANFVDGKLTASMAAKEVKSNLQLEAGNDTLKSVQKILDNALASSPLFNIAALPKQIYPFLLSKYGVGNYYGWHVDSPIMGAPALRTDMAMTIFLTDPSTYTGGELLIQQGGNVLNFKPAKGDAILYPCQYLHCVNKIETGERLAAVTWIQSNVKNPEQREMLFQLNQIHGSLNAQAPHAAETNMLLQVHSNLFRMWGEV
jgi:PKHD-type hydroxylase